MQAPEKMKERDVFKASHDKQAAAIEQGNEVAGNPSDSAQVRQACTHHMHCPRILDCAPFSYRNLLSLSGEETIHDYMQTQGSRMRMQRGYL